MELTDDEIWIRVSELEGQTLHTYVEYDQNTILSVEDTNRNIDSVVILDRKTRPKKEEILAAYRLLILQGTLKRMPDLEWLADKSKMVSSIVFRIVGEISKDHTYLDRSKREPVIILNK